MFISSMSTNHKLIDQELYECSHQQATSFYLNGPFIKVLSQDRIIRHMIICDFIRIDDVIPLYNQCLIPTYCLAFIHANNASTSTTNVDHSPLDIYTYSSCDNTTQPHQVPDTSGASLHTHYQDSSELPKEYNYLYHNSYINSLDSLTENSATSYLTSANTSINVSHSNEHIYTNKNNSSEVTTHASVVNLSDRQLSESEIQILERGMKFCPTPGEPDMGELHEDLDKLHLRLKRYLHFYKLPNPNNDTSLRDITIVPTPELHQPFKHPLFKLPSAWIPPPVINLENFIFKNHRDLSDSNIPKIRNHNITVEERHALQSLSKDTNIVIKPADKGGAVVVWDRQKYIKEGVRQLSDPKFYIETETDLTSTHYKEVVTVLDDMRSHKEIDDKCYDYLTHTPIRTAQFYMLPKIHKDLSNPPGRPIVSGNGCPTERISQFVDFFLQPGVKNIRSYIKDTTHFLSVLNPIHNLPEGAILATLDVSSLYTNIPNTEGIEACRIMLQNERPLARTPFNDSLIKLLKLVLSKNNFDFNEKHYLQTGGTAMGTRVAPSYANTFMGWFEDTFVYPHNPSPIVWKRFIDDIFIIWTHGRDSLNDFVSYLNGCLPSIKFEAESSTAEVHFLDVTVSIDADHNLQTDLYTKPTDSHNYLNYRSAHPRHCRDGIPYSQFLRLKRICSTEDAFLHQCREMSKNFIKAEYPANVIRKAFSRVFHTDRTTLLNPSVKEEDDPNEGEERTFLITTFHPNFRECDKVVQQNWDILEKSSSTRPLLNLKLIKGNRRAKNLRDILVRARLPRQISDTAKSAVRNTNTPLNVCQKQHCQYCTMLDKTGRITSIVTNKEYNTRSQISCRSNNIVYCLCCQACGKHYVGQTKRPLVERLREHVRNINQNTDIHIVGRHFNEPGHNGIRSLSVKVLNFAKGHPDSKTSLTMRLELESKWIKRLRCFVPRGLNLMKYTERK